MPSLDFDKEKNAFREHYSGNQDLFNRAASHVENLIASLTSSSEGLDPPNVSHRVKDREECIKKFARKYQTQLEQDKLEYDIASHITDIIGLRVVCYYETDIPKVVSILRDNFDIIDETDKSAELEANENAFGYKGHHLDIKINAERSKLPEYKHYQTLRFEVQVRSTIQDAWSVLDHKIKYKKSIPHTLKRQINALAALFEIADREFTNIRELTEELRETKAAVVQAGKDEPSQPLDVFEFLAIVQPRFSDFQFQGYKADGFVQEVNRWSPSLDATSFRSAIDTHGSTVAEYQNFQKEENGNDLNPYTQIRHILYLADKEKFALILYDIQRSNFDKWLAARPAEK